MYSIIMDMIIGMESQSREEGRTREKERKRKKKKRERARDKEKQNTIISCMGFGFAPLSTTTAHFDAIGYYGYLHRCKSFVSTKQTNRERMGSTGNGMYFISYV